MAIRKTEKRWEIRRENEARNQIVNQKLVPENQIHTNSKLSLIKEQIKNGYYEQPEVMKAIAARLIQHYGPL